MTAECPSQVAKEEERRCHRKDLRSASSWKENEVIFSVPCNPAMNLTCEQSVQTLTWNAKIRKEEMKRQNKLMPWCVAILDKLVVPQLVMKHLAFYGCRKFTASSQELATSPYREPDEVTPQ